MRANFSANLAPLLALALVGSAGGPCSILAQDSSSLTVVDNTDPELITRGTWVASSDGEPYGEDALYARGRGKAVFAPGVPPGYYNVFLRWTSREDLSARVPIVVKAVDARYKTIVNQRENGDQWNPLGAFDLDGSSKVILRVRTRLRFVCADAVRFELVESYEDPTDDDDPNLEPPVDPVDDPILEPPVDPVDDPNLEPPVDPVDDPNLEPPVDPVDDPNLEPPVDPVDDPNLEPPVDPVDDPLPETATTTLTWDAPTTNLDGTQLDDLAGFNVYEKPEDGVFVWIADVGEPQFTLGNISAGTYAYVVTAYDASGNESDWSNEVVCVIGSHEDADPTHSDPNVDPNLDPNLDPNVDPNVDPNLDLTGDTVDDPPAEMGSATLTWDVPEINQDGTPLDDLSGFNVYEKSEDGVFVWVTDASAPEVTFENLPAGIYTYAVTAYDTSGNESNFSNEVVSLVP